MDGERLVARAVEAVCVALERLHRLLARVLGGGIAGFWRAQGRLRMPVKMSLAFLLLAALMAWCAWFIPTGYVAWAHWQEDLLRLLDRAGGLHAASRVRVLSIAAGALCLVAAGAAWIRRKWVLWLMKAAWAMLAIAWANAFAWGLTAPAALNAADFRMFDSASRNSLWTADFMYSALFLLLPGLVLLWLVLADTRRWYERYPWLGVQPGDKLVETLRTGGADPRFRTSGYWSSGLFVFVLVLPFLIRGCGWEEPYGLVQGSGEPEIEVTMIKRIKQPRKQKKLVVNAWSPYIFDRMKIDDTDVMKNLLQETMDTYSAQTPKTGGRLGKGGGKTGGWPKGMEGAVVRFIRLKYNGGDWDQDMGKGADYNLLVHFNQITGFPIARDTEAIEISRLKRFPKDRAPPFVFLTGRGNINVSDGDIKTLRWYLEEEGGMLFIDNGGGHFDRSVRALLSRVLPGKSVVDIANDDPIYRAPYVFPNGAPPFWHHAGNRALGVKIDGRWAVFYHPGDINDAWKDGHSGAAKEIADQAYKLGVNVMYYSFNAYYARHYEQEGQ